MKSDREKTSRLAYGWTQDFCRSSGNCTHSIRLVSQPCTPFLGVRPAEIDDLLALATDHSQWRYLLMLYLISNIDEIFMKNSMKNNQSCDCHGQYYTHKGFFPQQPRLSRSLDSQKPLT
jgi:hypothetical protein